MAVFIPRAEPRVDSRGLPEGMDSNNFYSYAIEKRSKEAVGIEGLLYQILPWSVIRSFAIAIDPFYQFKVAPGVISPVSRVRMRQSDDVFGVRQYTRSRFAQACQTQSDPQNGFVQGAYTCVPPVNDKLVTASNPQPILTSSSSDTTRRTRLLGSEQGEFENFKYALYVPQRTTRCSFDITQNYTVWFPVRAELVDRYTDSVSSAATLSKASLDNIVIGERAACANAVQDNVLSMYKNVNPQFRKHTLFRDIAELKDLPRSIIQLRDTARNFQLFERGLHLDRGLKHNLYALTTSLRDIPKEYVSHHFGWKLLCKSVFDLMTKPAEISKQIDLLIRRSGKASTYRTSKKLLSVQSGGTPSFDYDPLLMRQEGALPGQPLTESRIEREIELKLVINTTFDFPTLNRPKFAHDLFYDKLGLNPRPTDLYNLVPWTWLIDWFTGLGNYIDVIDEINRDSSIINWGFITAISRGKLLTEHSSRTYNSKTHYQDFVPTTTEFYRPFHCTSVAEWTFQSRKNLANCMSVKTTADVTTLNSYQQSILGALILGRTNFRR